MYGGITSQEGDDYYRCWWQWLYYNETVEVMMLVFILVVEIVVNVHDSDDKNQFVINILCKCDLLTIVSDAIVDIAAIKNSQHISG